MTPRQAAQWARNTGRKHQKIQEKGKQLYEARAAQKLVYQEGHAFSVRSEQGKETYTILFDADGFSCTCGGFQHRGICKHVVACAAEILSPLPCPTYDATESHRAA